MDQFQYKVSKKADDHMDAVIEKSGFSSVTFTLRDIQKKQEQWSAEKRQMEGQIVVEQAKVDNIVHHHPWVAKMSEEKQFTTWLYYEARKTVEELKKQVADRVSALDEYQKEKEIILKTLGFEKTAI